MVIITARIIRAAGVSSYLQSNPKNTHLRPVDRIAGRAIKFRGEREKRSLNGNMA